jgi:O-antigen/teichoic acid export membrane protein
VNLSALKSIAERPEDREWTAAIAAGSLVLVLALGGIAACLYYAAREPIARSLESPGVAEGIAISAPGLFFFALNKVLLSIVNALRRMRSFAACTALRYALLPVGLLVWMAGDPDRDKGDGLAFVFTFSEGILFLVLAVEVARQIRLPVAGAWKDWVGPHLAYGAKSLASGVLLELNAKVDVWMIGLYLADRDVGVYAMAAMVAEGIYQLLVVLQNNVTRSSRGRSRRRTGRASRRSSGACASGRTSAWPRSRRSRSRCSRRSSSSSRGAGVRRGSAPLRPPRGRHRARVGVHSFRADAPHGRVPGLALFFMLATVLVNVAGNAVLIPRIGIAGAAAATAISMLASVFLLKALVRSRVGVGI